MGELKNGVADLIDREAVRVGARTNLLPDDKILNKVDIVRNGRKLDDFDFTVKNDINQLNTEIKEGLHDNVLDKIASMKNRSESKLLL